MDQKNKSMDKNGKNANNIVSPDDEEKLVA